MLDQSQPEKRKKRPHPLEAPPEPMPQRPSGDMPQQKMLRLPVTKPFATYILVAINVAIFVGAVYIANPRQLNDLYTWGANHRRAVLDMGEYYRLLSSMFLHSTASVAHIFFNMYALWIIGQTVESYFGHARFLVIYFLGGLLGSILSVLFNDLNAFSVGASGAVFAIFGAEMVFLRKHRHLFGEMAKRQLRQLIIIAGMNFAIGIASAMNPGGINIDNWGHVGGLLGGLLLAWIICPLLLPKQNPMNFDEIIIEDVNHLERHYQTLALYVAGLLSLIIIGVATIG